MTYFEKMLLAFLQRSKIKMEIDGFDMEGFHKAVREENERRLEMIESVIDLDSELMTDAEKVSAIREYFEEGLWL